MRYIIAFEDDLSLFLIRITKSIEYMYHMITSECLVFESGKFSFISIFSELSEREIEKIIFGSDLWIFECDLVLMKKLEKCSVDYILTNEEKIGKICSIEILSHEKLYEDILIEPA